jgi:BirA family biotin operon repressor/biotin-[acetyl-CoA-carboxylase] ligase
LNQFSDSDLDMICRSTFVEQIEFHPTIDSTNNRALAVAGEPGILTSRLILTEVQTGGRGRGANRWWASRGALTFSLLIRTDSVPLPPQRLPLASLTVGLAVCEALEEMLSLPDIRIKWPNDVYIGLRKVGGILIELPPGVPELLVIGIGINVNNSMQRAPDELRSSVIALCDASGNILSLQQVLLPVLVRLQTRLAAVDQHNTELMDHWRSRCLLTNRTVQVVSPARRIEGLCRGIDHEGALLIETQDRLERCFGGTVARF